VCAAEAAAAAALERAYAANVVRTTSLFNFQRKRVPWEEIAWTKDVISALVGSSSHCTLPPFLA
jgi:hypothetical protein